MQGACAWCSPKVQRHLPVITLHRTDGHPNRGKQRDADAWVLQLAQDREAFACTGEAAMKRLYPALPSSNGGGDANKAAKCGLPLALSVRTKPRDRRNPIAVA